MKKLKLFFGIILAISLMLVTSATRLDTAENAVLAEVTAATVELKPGLNMWTGTTDVYTFDGAEAVIDTDKFDFTASVGTFATETNSNNQALLFNNYLEYMGLKSFPAMELERPVKIKVNVLKYGGQPRFGDTVTVAETTRDNHDIVVIYGNATNAIGAFEFDVLASQAKSAFLNSGNYGTYDGYKSSDKTAPFKNLMIYYYSETTKETWVDDVAIIPYYKINYDVNGGTGSTIAPSYYYNDDTSIPFTDFAKGDTLINGDKVFVGWAETPDATVDEVMEYLFMTPGQDKTVYAVYSEPQKAELKPGINILTGNKNSLTFDSENTDEILSTLDTKDISVVNYPTDSDNKAVYFNKQYGYIGQKNFPAIELERPVELKFNVLFLSGCQVRFAAISDVVTARENADIVTTLKAGNWSYTANASEITACRIINQSGSVDSYKEAYHGKPFANLYFYGYSSKMNAYVDDLAVIPYYKITYIGLDGEVAATDYALLSESGEMLEYYTPDASLVEGSSGFALTADGEKVDSVKLENADIVLYVVEGYDPEKYTAPQMMDTTEIRGNGTNNGIRFKSAIKPSAKENLNEFGFIATKQSLLLTDGDVYDYSALTFEFVDGNNVKKYAAGVSYDEDNGIDFINSELSEGGSVYSAVLTGIPLNYKNEVLAVRAYAKFTVNNNEYTVYSGAVCDSLYNAANRIKNENGEAYANNKTYIDSVLAD